VRDVENTIVQVTESAVREIVGKSTLDFIITEGRSDIQEKTRALLQEILDRYKSGIQIVTVQMQKASPPDEVKAAFDDAVKAREDEQRLKNEAEPMPMTSSACPWWCRAPAAGGAGLPGKRDRAR